MHTAEQTDVLWAMGQDFVGLLWPCCPSFRVCVIDVPECCASLSCYTVVKAFLVKYSSGGGNGEMAFYFFYCFPCSRAVGAVGSAVPAWRWLRQPQPLLELFAGQGLI